MSDTADTEQALRQAITARIATLGDPGAIVVNYHVTAEIVTQDEEQPWLKVLNNEGHTTWGRVGMLTAALQLANDHLQAGWAENDDT